MLPVGIVILASTLLTLLVAGSTTAFVFFKLIAGLGLIGLHFVLNKKSATKMLGSRSTALWAVNILTAFVFVAVLGTLNFISYKNPKEYDVTREGIYTLADQTTKTLQGLKEEITVYAFYRSDEQMYRAAKDTLERFQSFAGDKLKIEWVNPSERPEMVEKYQIREGGSRMVFTAKNAHEARPKDLTEQELTNALVKVTGSSTKKVYFVTGHGEADSADTTGPGTSEMLALLKNEGYEVATFSFAGNAAGGGAIDLSAAAGGTVSVPSDAQVVIVTSSKSVYAQGELDALDKFLEKGGRVIMGLEGTRQNGLEKLAAKWHVEAQNDVVVDTVTRALGLPPTIGLVQQYEEHALTKDFRQPLVLPTARSLIAKGGGGPDQIESKIIARTGKTAWGETEFPKDPKEKQQVTLDPAKDHPGPVGLVAVATKKATVADKVSDEARLVVFGDSEFITNQYFQFQGNGDFFANTVNYLSDEEGKISIRPKARGASRIFLTETQSDVITFFSVDILPVAIAALGVAIRAVRRRK